MDVSNALGAHVGDQVLLEVREVNMLKAAFIIYFLPLIAIAVGAGAGYGISRWIGRFETGLELFGAVLLLLVSIVVIRGLDRSMKKAANLPVVVKIIT